MSRAPEELAPSWFPRHQRRRIDRQIYKLLHQDDCSVCRSPLKHNSCTTSGLDAQGNVVLAGECCASRVAVVFGRGLYSNRRYDFLSRRSSEPNIKATNEQIADAIAAYQKAIAGTDEQLANVERRGGVGGVRVRGVSLLDHPWKADDRDWFERNQKRSHRWRLPFSGEFDELAAQTPAGLTLIVLVRQVELSARLKGALYFNADLLPLPNDEAVAYALFEAAVGREPVPPDRQALFTLSKKYSMRGGPGDA
jgi:hypothetical protein